MMLSLQSDNRLHHHHQLQISGGVGYSRVLYEADRDDAFVINSEQQQQHEVDEDTLLSLAHQKYRSGNYKQALDHSSAIYERNPRRTDNLLLLGAIHYQLHDFDTCIVKNEEAVCIDPTFAECFGNMANAWKEKGNIDRAIYYYLRAIELRPNFSDAWSNLASAYMRKGRCEEAIKCRHQALALNPGLVDAHSNLGNLMKAKVLVQEGYINIGVASEKKEVNSEAKMPTDAMKETVPEYGCKDINIISNAS